MHLDDALRAVAAYGNLNADELIAYAAEDTLGGRDTGDYSHMSPFRAEGQILYALIRTLKPTHILEIGCNSGGSATHMLAALDANGAGELTSVDIDSDCGWQIPEHLRSRWNFVHGDAVTVEFPADIDFVFEDGAHDFEFTSVVLERTKALPARVIISHDYHQPQDQGFYVKEAFAAVMGEHVAVLVDGSISGLGVWFR